MPAADGLSVPAADRRSALPALLAGPVLEAAPRLLGAVITSTSPEGTVSIRLTEVEAYDGTDDPGSHGFRGPTRRNEVMFGPPGHAYVYFTYGMHHCINIVCAPRGKASAVLLRAGEVIAGVELARQRRAARQPTGSPARVPSDRDLARGPARLCVCLDVDLRHNGVLLMPPNGVLSLALAAEPVASAVACGPRVGLRSAADRPWRFWLSAEPTVSPYRPAARRPLRASSGSG